MDEKTLFTLLLLIASTIAIFGIIYVILEQLKKNKDGIMMDEIIDMCKNSKTIEECNETMRYLYEKCIENESFKINKCHWRNFYEVRANLLGKLEILENKKNK